MKEKLRNKGFWLGLIGAVIMFLQAIGIKVDVPAVNEIISALMAILVVLGVVTNSTAEDGEQEDGQKEQTQEDADDSSGYSDGSEKK